MDADRFELEKDLMVLLKMMDAWLWGGFELKIDNAEKPEVIELLPGASTDMRPIILHRWKNQYRHSFFKRSAKK